MKYFIIGILILGLLVGLCIFAELEIETRSRAVSAPLEEALVEKAREQAIGAKLLLARAEQLDIPVPEAAIDAQVEKVVQQVGGREDFVKALAAQKISEDDFRRELAKGCRVDMLVQQACSGVAEPTEQEVADWYAAHKDSYRDGQTIVDVADQIRDLLRHEARGRAMDAFIAELRENAKIEYR